MVNAFMNLSKPKFAHKRSMIMLKNEDKRIEISKQSAMLILRAFQLLKSKVRHWADLNSIIKRRNYEEKQRAYVLAKK